MFTSLFVKKKISHKEIAQKFVHHTLQTIDDTYSDFLDAIFYDPELTEHPPLDYKDPRKLSLIIIAGNMKFFEKILSAYEENNLCQAIIEEMSKAFETNFHEMQAELEKYSSFISRVNHPSKNILYGMSKAVFFKFKLGKYQEDYFAQLNTPNPIFLKRIDNLVENYIWDWKSFFDKTKITL